MSKKSFILERELPSKDVGVKNKSRELPSPAQREFTDITVIRVSAIVTTPMRLIDLIENADGVFTLRQTEYRSGTPGVQQIQLYGHELEKLADVVAKIRKFSGGA